MNDFTRLASAAALGSMRLSATCFVKPAIPVVSARCTVAMPPRPICSYTRYGPNSSVGAPTMVMEPRLRAVWNRVAVCCCDQGVVIVLDTLDHVRGARLDRVEVLDEGELADRGVARRE